MKITLGITTYNRIKILELFASSLYKTKGLETVNIRVYDDCSTEYGVEKLNELFPDAKDIICRNENYGPDENMRLMYVDFLCTEDDILITMDSDLIVRSDWLEFLNRIFHKTDGVLSLYNSILHPTIANDYIDGVELEEKNHLGSAGTVFSREILRDIVNILPPSDRYDWDWSEMLMSEGIKLYASSQSYFQHIGLSGSNHGLGNIIDFGVKFYPDNEVCKDILLSYYHEYQLLSHAKIININNKFTQSYSYRLGNALLSPLRAVAKHFK